MPDTKLKELGLSVDSMLISDSYDGFNGSHVHMVVLHYRGKSMSMEYTSGCAHRHHPRSKKGAYHNGRLTVDQLAHNKKTVPNDPSLADVVYSTLLDASAGRYSMSFADFCGDYGYDEDSRSAFKIYEACMDQYSKLRSLGVDLEALDEILEDY